MWSIALSTVVVSLIGAFAHFTQPVALAEQRGNVAASVESMAVYRAAVVRYFSAHAAQVDTSVDLATLRNEGALRDWSTLPADRWNNYRAPDGTIYIYGAPSADVETALARQAQNSLLAGTYHQATASLHAPAHGNTGIPLAPLLAHRKLVDGAPVWLAGIQ
jgi:PilM